MIENILIALLILASVALLMGVLLAIVSNFFHVEEDEKFLKLRECLPGVNCGACGYKGCDDYANAMARGEAKANLCIPGAEPCAKHLAELLGVENEEPEDFVAFINCNGNCEATTNKLNYDGINTCRAASTVFGGPKGCNYGCLGFGDCTKVCPSGAICIKDGIAHVDTTLCLGCGMCISECPKKVMSLVPQEAKAVVMCNNHETGASAMKVCKNACIACKKCEKACPYGAITVVNNLSRIDYEKCTGCHECVSACPTGCLKAVDFPDLDFEKANIRE